MEYETTPKVIVLGSLADFGLGNREKGIPSELAGASEAEVIAYGEKVAESMMPVTDLEHYACIDGRCRICNADGSAPENRMHQVGGTQLIMGVALNSESLILDTIQESPHDPYAISRGVEKEYEKMTGVKRSSHLGDCGGANGAVEDQRNIASNPIITEATEKFMAIPEVRQFTGIDFDQGAADLVCERAGKTAQWMEEDGWDGPTYVADVEKDEPAGVEDLEADHDHPYHGHNEPAFVWVINMGEKMSPSDAEMQRLGITRPFVGHVNASLEMAQAIGGSRGQEGVVEALIANFDEHFAVGDRLPSPDAKVILIVTY